METIMELKTSKISLRGKLMNKLLKVFAEFLASKGKSICDPSLVARMGKWTVPKGYSYRKYDCGDFKLELIRKGEGNPDGHVIYYLHGGGYTMPLSNTYRKLAVKVSKLTNDSDVVLLDYRIAPKYVYPAALNDALGGWEKLQELGYSPEHIALFGESAGGNLCIALTAKLRDLKQPLPCCMAVMSAWTDFSASGKSYRENLMIDPLFGLNRYMTEPNLDTAEQYAGKTELDNPGLSPVFGSFEGFPPMLMQAGTSEMLFSDTESVFRKAKKAGVKIIGQAYHGMFHGFQCISEHLPESKIAWNETGKFLKKMFRAQRS